MSSAADDILLHLKTRGPTPTQSLATRLGVSRQAARQHLEKLAGDGLVQHATERADVGRPRRAWSLSKKGHARFPDTHAQMTVELIEAARAEFGEAGLERLVARRERASAAAYTLALSETASLEDRLSRLAVARAGEGYMAEWRREEGGAYLLMENHCPICAAASACQGFCHGELALFQSLLAPARVERVEHILSGARRCAYRITPSD